MKSFAGQLFIVCTILGIIIMWHLPDAAKRNARSLEKISATFSEISWDMLEKLNFECNQVREYYAESDYQQVVDTLLFLWLDTPSNSLRPANCRPAAFELAASLNQLRRFEEEQQVYHRIIDINPGSRDWVMHFAQLAVGDEALKIGNWQTALDHYVISYECALNTSSDIEPIYEKRAWDKLRLISRRSSSESYLHDAISYANTESEKQAGISGWHIESGLLNEQEGKCLVALENFKSAQLSAPKASYLDQYVQNLERTCIP